MRVRLDWMTCVTVMAAALPGCVGTSTRLAPIPKQAIQAEQERQRELALQEHQEQQRRLDSIAYPILAGAVDLCPDAVGPRYGLSIASVYNYEPEWRPAAKSALNLGDDASILSVTPDSPAADAGLQPGDHVLAVSGKSLGSGESAVTNFNAAFDDKAKDVESPVVLIVDRGGRKQTITVSPNRTCAYPTIVAVDGELNAYSDGQNIIVTSTMMRFATDQELAVVISHEFAHNAMGHLKAKKKNSLFGALIGALGDIAMASRGVNTGGYYASQGAKVGALSFSQDFEREADYVGLYALAASGHSLESAPTFWRHMAQEDPKSISMAYTHPTTAERFVRMEQEIAEIEHKQAVGLALQPELKRPAKNTRDVAPTDNVFATRTAPRKPTPARPTPVQAMVASHQATVAPTAVHEAPDTSPVVATPGMPVGTRWVASISEKMYYPAACAAVKSVPEEDRLYYSTEDAPSRAGFRRTIVCD